MAKRCHRNKRHQSADDVDVHSQCETETSVNRRPHCSLTPSTLQEESLKNMQFFEVTRLFMKDPHLATMAITNMTHFFPMASARPSTTNDEEVILRLVESTDQTLISNRKDISTQSNLKAHETKEDYRRKLKSVHPDPLTNSNVFLFMTDASGKCMLHASTNTNPKNKKSRKQNVTAEEIPKNNNTSNAINLQPGNSEELNSENILNNLSMSDARTQTKHKFKYKHECAHHQKHLEHETSKYEYDTEELSRSCEIPGGTCDKQASLTHTESNTNMFTVNNSETTLVKEAERQAVNSNNQHKFRLNYYKYMKETGRIDKMQINNENITLSDPTYISNESSTENSDCTKTTVVQNASVPKYLKAQFNNDTHSNYEKTSTKETKDKILITDDAIINKAETKSTLPQNINISIDGAKESYNVNIQYNDSKHEKCTINTLINKLNSPHSISENALIKKKNLDTLKTNGLLHLHTIANVKKNTTPLARINFRNDITTTAIPIRDLLSSPSYAAGNHENGTLSRESRRRRQVHYRGDSCLLKDPVERDEEIQRLLGVDRRHYVPSVSKSQPSWSAMMSKTCSRPFKKVSSSSERIPPEKSSAQKAVARKVKKHKRHVFDKIAYKKDPEVEYSLGEPNHKDVNIHKKCCQHKPIPMSATEHSKLQKASCDCLHLIRNNMNFTRQHIININTLRTKHNILSSNKPDLGDKAVSLSKLDDIHGNTGPLEICHDCDLVKEKLVVSDTDCTGLTVQGNRINNPKTEQQSFRIRNVVSSPYLCESRDKMYSATYVTKLDLKIMQNSLKEFVQRLIIENMEKSSDILETSCDNLEPRVIKTSPSIVEKKVTRCSPVLGKSTFSVCKSTKPDIPKVSKTSHPKTHHDRSFFKRLTQFLTQFFTRRKWKDIAAGRDVSTNPAEVTPESVIDSYSVNEYFAARELSSSMYEFGTSASHYSQLTTRTVARPSSENSNKSFFIDKFKNYFK